MTINYFVNTKNNESFQPFFEKKNIYEYNKSFKIKITVANKNKRTPIKFLLLKKQTLIIFLNDVK